MRTRMTEFISNLQSTIITELENIDPTVPRFTRRTWDRAQGGRGIRKTGRRE
ncbi:hypothetical protein QCA50_007212 [Cerrena zonata]|uniref:Coproporphyrinogen III oxidase n=1 Tax=Cerrena zonata TaxID=2478898 RepID=A0AAW0GE39_9APHY